VCNDDFDVEFSAKINDPAGETTSFNRNERGLGFEKQFAELIRRGRPRVVHGDFGDVVGDTASDGFELTDVQG
jgi:hypothetical protein